jgi:hypothetical protein
MEDKIMRKIAHIRELIGLTDLPVEVVNIIRDAVIILDEEYGENRDVDSGYGGYVLVIEHENDLTRLQESRNDVETVPEYVDVVTCNDGQKFASSLILQGSDFGLLLIMPLSLLTENLRQYASL